MIDVFISYRRSDTRADAGRLYDRLAERFGGKRVFMDIDDLRPGENFVRVLEETLDRCTCLLLLIGPDWLNCKAADGTRRIDNAGDFVRLEIERALARGVRLIPVLVGGARMPEATDLPDSLLQLVEQQAATIHDGRFHPDVDLLIATMESEAGGIAAVRQKLRRNRAGIALLVAALAAVLWLGVIQPGLREHARQTMVARHLDTARQLVHDGLLADAVAVLDSATAQAPDAIAPRRLALEIESERLSREAFIDNGAILNIGLRTDIDQFRPIDESRRTAVLARISGLLAAAPELDSDVDLLFTRARILKTFGGYTKAAAELLRRAHALDPKRADVVSELGLLLAVVLGDDAGPGFLEQGVALAPTSARAHFYLAQGLSVRHRCSDSSAPLEGQPCADALRGYARATTLANDGTLWSRHIRHAAGREARGVFSRVARADDDILDRALAMPDSERLSILELMLGSTGFGDGMSGWTDDPQFWRARLYEATSQPQRARAILEDRIGEAGARDQLPQPWRALLERTGGIAP